MTRSDQAAVRQGRMVALVIAGTVMLWLAAQWIGGWLGLPSRFVYLFDLAALAGFLSALIVTFGLWRRRNGAGKES